MIVIPNRLYGEPFVEVFYKSPHFSILKKHLTQTLINRQSYVSLHAVSMVITGEQKIIGNENQVIYIQQGEIGFIRKGIYTVTDLFSNQKGFQSYLLYFDDELLKQVLSLYSKPNSKPKPKQKTSFKTCFKIASSPALLQYFESLKPLSQSVQKPSNPLFRVKVMEFLALAIAENESFNLLNHLHGFTHHRPQNLRAFMGENFDKPLTVADYAYLTGRSLSTFRREFKVKFGLSPRKWIIQERMKKAKKLLETGNESVANTAYEVGYENVSHFITGFKKYYGHTPKQTISSEKKLLF